MALLKKKLSEIPSDAVVLTEKEAIEYQLNVLKNWKPESDLLAFRYGPSALGAASFLSGIFINTYFRNKFRLMHYGRGASYLAVCALPALMSFMLHEEFVTKDLVLDNVDTCPICIESRSSAIQSMLGCVFPAVLAPITSASVALKYGTYNIPYIQDEPRKLFEMFRKLGKPIANILFCIFLGQAVLASVVTSFEAKSIQTVNRKLSLLEEKFDTMHHELSS